MFSRREFIKGSLSAGCLLGSGLGLSACSGVKREAPTGTYKATAKPLPLTDTQMKVLYLASLAPSNHNTQPWRVRASSMDSWIIEADARCRLPAVDPSNRALLLSIGAFVENLTIAAGSMGLNAQVDVIARQCMDRDLVRIFLVKDTPVVYPLACIKKRRTVKIGQLSKEITAVDVAVMKKHANGQVFYFPRGSKHAQCLQEAAVDNFRVQTNRDEAQQELTRWLRLSDADARTHRDGLSAEGLEITGLKGWFMRHLASPEDFMKRRYRDQGIDRIAKLAGQGGGWFVITSRGHSPADLIDAGRCFQRLALAACELNIGIHPMTQVLEENHGFAQFADHHDAGIIPQFLLRAGYLNAYPKPVSLRRPVEWFLSRQKRDTVSG